MNFSTKKISQSRLFGKDPKGNKNRASKTHNTLFMVLTIISVIYGCSKDDNNDIPNNITELTISEGVTEDDFEKFQGELGFVLNTRNIAKKGYKPTKALVTIDANNGNYSETIDLDEFSFLGQIKIPIESLSSEAADELKNGVPISVDIKDENDNTIIAENLSSVLFKSNATPNTLNVSELDETEEVRTIALKEDTPYYIQKVDKNGKPLNKAMRVDRNSGYFDPHRRYLNYRQMTVSTNDYFEGANTEPDFIFNFIPIPGEFNTYAIKLQHDDRFLYTPSHSNYGHNNVDKQFPVALSNITSFNDVQNLSYNDHFKFIIEKVGDGIYNIKSFSRNLPIHELADFGLIIPLFDGGDTVNWRIVSNSIDWTAETIGTTFSSPILSSPSTDFGANSTLTNCGKGLLVGEVGSDKTTTTSNTVGWEERFSLTGSVTTNLSTTVGVEFEAGFYGASAKYSGSVTASLETSVAMTEESTEFGKTTTGTTETIFFKRTVDVLPGTASLVYDVAQIYDNVTIQLVQRIRLRATESGKPLSGIEIRSQLQFSKFSGVVSQVGSDFLDITIKGTSKLANVLELKSTVLDVPAACN